MSTFTTVAKAESILSVVRSENCQRPQENLDSYKYISFYGNPLQHYIHTDKTTRNVQALKSRIPRQHLFFID